MVGIGIVIGIALVCGGVCLWDKWKKDCVKAGVCKFDGQEASDEVSDK